MAIEMHFLPDVYVTCEECKGQRYNRETLEIEYRGKSIAEVLNLTVGQALPLLENVPPIATKLRTLVDVGLGYIELGQSATTLSGGEAQRVKLAKELSRRSTGRTLYILDEPTTGLHFEDTKKLLDVIDRLVDQGNTVVIIEHNIEVIKSADHVIDLGPEGGGAGGRIVAQGSPEDVAAQGNSHTGRFLARLFDDGATMRQRALSGVR
jgi:excinuclease ABC subunit A